MYLFELYWKVCESSNTAYISHIYCCLSCQLHWKSLHTLNSADRARESSKTTSFSFTAVSGCQPSAMVLQIFAQANECCCSEVRLALSLSRNSYFVGCMSPSRVWSHKQMDIIWQFHPAVSQHCSQCHCLWHARVHKTFFFSPTELCPVRLYTFNFLL